jgi:hypothetical protein
MGSLTVLGVVLFLGFFVSADEGSLEYLNCLCRCLEPPGGQFGCGYDTRDKGWSPSCGDLSNGPCICKAYGCFRGQLPTGGECYEGCQEMVNPATTSLPKPSSAGAVPIPDDAGDAVEALRKCNDLRTSNPTLTEDEFVRYLRFIEGKNPGMDWKKIMAQLHFQYYGDDVGRRTPIIPIPLFAHGADTDGHRNVNTFCRSVPKFVVDRRGARIDIAHSYAGLRSDLNRDFRPWRWLMRNLNTDWGDYWQVVMHFDRKYAPPDQLRGNKVGKWLAAYYSKPENSNKPLSRAYSDYFMQAHD